MQIRHERPEDANQISLLTAAAFKNASHSGGNESRIVEALRSANALTVSLVAVADDNTIIGHIVFSPVQIDHRPGDWYGLGPVSVTPHLQKRGIGTALILEGLNKLRDRGAGGCVLVGEPAYYRRFGFRSDPGLTYMRFASPYFQYLILKCDPPAGDVTYHSAFSSP